MIVPIEVSGPTGGHRSVQFGSALTQNMYIDLAESRTGVFDLPGLKAFGTCVGNDRGSHVMGTQLFKLCGSTLYSVGQSGSFDVAAAGVSGNGRAVFADDGLTLYFVTNRTLYRFDLSTLSVVAQTVVNNVHSIAYINRQFIIAGSEGIFATSDVGDGSEYNALNFAEAETNPDPLVRPYVFNQLVYMLGSKGTELWYNSGVGNPPFDRQDTALVNVGLAGRHAIVNTDQYLYWLGDDKKVYQCVGASARSISTGSADFPVDGVSHKIERYSQVSDCVASTFLFEGQDFVLFSFPAAGKRLLYSETFNYWVEIDGPHLQVVRAYGKYYVSDASNGNLYEMDADTYTDNGAARIRVRTLPTISGSLIGAPNQRILVKRLRLNMQVGVGLTTGQGVDPVVMCQFSPDGGHTWQAERHVSIGAQGNYMIPVDFWDFCSGYDIRVRISCSDPVFLGIFNGEVDIEAVGF